MPDHRLLGRDALNREALQNLLNQTGSAQAAHAASDQARVDATPLVVNQPSSTSAGGSLFNGFAPTTTLGCGTWGNNIISENVTCKHMINISRIGYFMKDRPAPTDEEIWAE